MNTFLTILIIAFMFISHLRISRLEKGLEKTISLLCRNSKEF